MSNDGSARHTVAQRETDERHHDGAVSPKKRRIYEEAAKTRETTHWDLDYLPLAEIDALDKARRKARPRSLRERLKEWLLWR